MRQALVAIALMVSGMAQASTSAGSCKEEKAGLAAKAKVTCADAQQTALARVPKAKVKSAEIEEEGGRLVYSFDLKQPGKKGIEEVQVDAATGAVVSVEHEGPAAEAAEKKADQKAQ
jgi:uncharacterized membrane protein YkoI